MHVLMTADCVGGVWTYALDLARALPQCRFSLATMGARPGPAQREAVAALPNARLFESDWKLEWQPNPWRDVERAGEWLLQLEREMRPDLVHLNGFSHGATPFDAPKIVVAHSDVGSWWRAVKGEDAPPDWNLYREKVRAGLGGAAAIVALTRAQSDELRAVYGCEGALVIPNGAAASREESENGEARPPIEIAFVLAAGRLWDEAKNIALLDAVAPHLSAPVRIAGAAGFGGDEFRARHLQLLGILTPAQMRAAMRQAAIWAHPARYEPFGLATLEAAIEGCALVLSDIPTLRELWHGAALFAPPDDARAWAKALNSLLQNDSARQNYARLARARAKDYSLQRFGRAYAALYAQLL